jgi:predicted pyridoxine 5'-phosphate oxidase superfamily flavin-nucleotide-binding protein
MAHMTEEMMTYINNMVAPYLATASKDGIPNVVPCGSTRAINSETITITARYLNKTFKNLQDNPNVAIVFHSELGEKGGKPREVKGWQIKGEATIDESGEYYERAKEATIKRFGGIAANTVKAAVVVKVQEIYNIALGP